MHERDLLVSVGALNVDVTAYVDELASEDGEQAIKEIVIHSGGQAGNIASGLSRLGKQAYFWGNIGDDQYTAKLTADFGHDGVNYSHAKRTASPNNLLYCFVDASGNRQMYVYNHVDLKASDFPEPLYNAWCIIFSSIIKEDAVELYTAIAREAKQRGVRIALDPGHILAKRGLDELRPLLELCDYAFPSEREAELLGGAETLSGILPCLIVTKGAQGAELYTNGRRTHIAPHPAHSVDTTGAGDCFAAAFLAAVHEGRNTEGAARYATAAAALSTTRRGARSMPPRADIESYAPHHH